MTQNASCTTGPIVREYVGLKLIKAWPQAKEKTEPTTEGSHYNYGYGIEYEDGYRSWSPKDVFEAAYKTSGWMDFSMALFMLKRGKKVARRGWNGKGMWLMLVPESLAESVSFQYAALKPLPWIGMKTADEHFVPWLASQTDMLAEDWEVIEQ